jgi:deoxycytidine triphosphate deaminase
MVEYTRFVDGIVHEPTQTEGRGLDLTVSDIYEVSEPGRVDFGGGELEAATVAHHESEKRNPDDDYEWWHLDAGTYLAEYNESLSSDNMRLTVQTRRALLERGASHPTLQVTDLPRVPLTVGGSGIRIKENARVSTIVGATPERSD